MSQLVTGEAVVLQVRLARMPTRALAATLDALLEFFALGVLVGVLVTFLEDANEALAAGIIIVCVVLVLIGYRLTMETLTRGQTLGKMALGLRVVRDDGSAIRFRHALVRTLMWLFVDFAPWFACCPGIVASLMNKQGKRIGDMVAGTVVIRERHQAIGSPPLFVPGPLVAWAASLELSRFSDDLANTAREYLARYTELEPAAREAIGNTLAAKAAEVTAPAPPAPMSSPAFLSAVLAERRRRELARLATTQVNAGVYGDHAAGSYGPAGPFATPQHVYAASPPPPPFGAPAPQPVYGAPEYGVAATQQYGHPDHAGYGPGGPFAVPQSGRPQQSGVQDEAEKSGGWVAPA